MIYDVCKQSEENISQYIKKYDIQNEVIFKKQRVSFSNAIDQLVKELKNWMDDRIIYSESAFLMPKHSI